ncbi:MAG: KH domain-containing protein [Patescibacteria group bacterium]|nr:KH domain-containing protein [Patescibacteria group bacterium]
MVQDQEFIEFVIKAIVNNPDEVKVTRTVDERGVLITLDLNPTDIGYVIGRRGNTVRAIRTLLKVVGAKNNALVNLKINEPEGSEHRRPEVASHSTPSSSMMEDVDTSAIDNLDI